MMAKRPSILLITSDQQRAACFGFEHARLETPHLDGLARDGTCFTVIIKAGYRPEVAWTCCDYADALLQRIRPGDREQANTLLTEALSLSRGLGMRPLMERFLSRREIVKA